MITGQLRIIAQSQEDAEEIAGYLYRLSGSRVWFWRPRPGREGQWFVYGEVEVPDEEDTRKWKKARTE